MTTKEMFEKMGDPYLVCEISEVLESGIDLNDIIRQIEANHPSYKFSMTTKMFETCIMAWFERR